MFVKALARVDYYKVLYNSSNGLENIGRPDVVCPLQFRFGIAKKAGTDCEVHGGSSVDLEDF